MLFYKQVPVINTSQWKVNVHENSLRKDYPLLYSIAPDEQIDVPVHRLLGSAYVLSLEGYRHGVDMDKRTRLYVNPLVLGIRLQNHECREVKKGELLVKVGTRVIIVWNRRRRHIFNLITETIEYIFTVLLPFLAYFLVCVLGVLWLSKLSVTTTTSNEHSMLGQVWDTLFSLTIPLCMLYNYVWRAAQGWFAYPPRHKLLDVQLRRPLSSYFLSLAHILIRVCIFAPCYMYIIWRILYPTCAYSVIVPNLYFAIVSCMWPIMLSRWALSRCMPTLHKPWKNLEKFRLMGSWHQNFTKYIRVSLIRALISSLEYPLLVWTIVRLVECSSCSSVSSSSYTTTAMKFSIDYTSLVPYYPNINNTSDLCIYVVGFLFFVILGFLYHFSSMSEIVWRLAGYYETMIQKNIEEFLLFPPEQPVSAGPKSAAE